MLTAAMTPELPTPADLREAPELASLELLQNAIDVARVALIAVHEQREGRRANDGEPNHGRTTLALAMRPLMNALSAMLLQYRRALLHEWIKRYPPPDLDDNGEPMW